MEMSSLPPLRGSRGWGCGERRFPVPPLGFHGTSCSWHVRPTGSVGQDVGKLPCVTVTVRNAGDQGRPRSLHLCLVVPVSNSPVRVSAKVAPGEMGTQRAGTGFACRNPGPDPGTIWFRDLQECPLAPLTPIKKKEKDCSRLVSAGSQHEQPP